MYVSRHIALYTPYGRHHFVDFFAANVASIYLSRPTVHHAVQQVEYTVVADHHRMLPSFAKRVGTIHVSVLSSLLESTHYGGFICGKNEPDSTTTTAIKTRYSTVVVVPVKMSSRATFLRALQRRIMRTTCC